MGCDLGRRPLDEHQALLDDVGPVRNLEGVQDVVVGDDEADILGLLVQENFLEFLDGQGIDPRERLVQDQEFGLQQERPANLELAPLAAGKAVGGLLRQAGEAQLFQQAGGNFFLFGLWVGEELQDHSEVALDRGLEENGILLGQIGDAEPGAG